MERFGSIKSYKSANQIQSLCRLCGMNNPGMTAICEDFDTDVIDLDDDPSLQRKIEACIGILVMPNDHLPQHCCGICTDKICDFFEFRLMCTSTDIQTRRLLGLPPRDERKPIIKDEPPLLMPAVAGPKSKGGRFLQPAQIKIEEPVLMEIAPPPDVVEESRRQAKTKKRNQLEPVLQLKRVKIEPEEINCPVCKDKFSSEGDKYAHMYNVHVPNYSKYGCSSCGIAFNQLEWKQHRAWHSKRKEPFTCFRCGESFDKFNAFSKHFQNNRCSEPLEITQPDIQCELCRKRFGTRNLYEWHACFIKNKTNCRKCGQYFANKHKLFTHFLKCPLPFIDIASTKPPAEKASKPKSSSKKTVERALRDDASDANNIKTEDDLDISALLETSIHETGKDEPCTSKISSLLESVNDAIDKISAEKAKSKKKEGRKSKNKNKKVTPLKLRIKPDPDANEKEPQENEDDDDLEHIPAEEHFAEVDSNDDDDDTASQTTNTETSGSVTPSVRIKKEKLDAAYGDAVTEKDPIGEVDPIGGETLQDLIRNIKKEPGVHTQEEMAAIIRARNSAQKVKKSINPLALKKKKKSSATRQQLILKIKKERTEKDRATSNEALSTAEKDPLTSPVRKALNPLAAALAKKYKKSKLLRIPAQLALRIKKEKAKNKNKPTLRIKREKPDSDEEHHEGPIETDYLGINPLSVFRQKNAQKKQKTTDQDSNGIEKDPTAAVEVPPPSDEKSMEVESSSSTTEKPEESPEKSCDDPTPAPSTSKPNPMSTIFGGKATGFMKLSLNSTGLDFGSSVKRSSPIQMPVIANIASGVDASFSAIEKNPESHETSNEESKKAKEETSTSISQNNETELKESSTPHVADKPEEVPPVTKPKLGGFMKISGTMGGFLQFPGIQKPPVEPSIAKPETLSSQLTPSPVSVVKDNENSIQTSQTPASEPEKPIPPPAPSIIPGFGQSSGFKKFSAFSLPSNPNTSTKNHETPFLTFPPLKNTTENNIQTPVISNISSLDLDDLISSPPHSSTDIDMESLLNEKLMDEEKLGSNCDNNGTDDFLKEIDEQLADGR